MTSKKEIEKSVTEKSLLALQGYDVEFTDEESKFIKDNFVEDDGTITLEDLIEENTYE